MSSPEHPTRLAVLVSGGGRSLENLCEVIERRELPCTVALVVCNKREAFALERARRRGLGTALVDPENRLSPAELSAAVFERVDAAGCDLVVMAGFLRLCPVPERWAGRVLNIHPSLLPAFGGKGCYGERVHAAVLERGVQFTGCTVHYVDDEYDHGRILLQRCIPVLPDDTVASLAARVFEEEKLALPEAIRRHLAHASTPAPTRPPAGA